MRKDLRILFINVCLRRGFPLKILPVGLASVITFVKEKGGYDFDLLDLDINDYDDEYVEKFLEKNEYDVILYGSIVTHYKWMKWLTHTIKRIQPNCKAIVGNSVVGSCKHVFMNNAPADVGIVGEGEFTTVGVLDALRDGTDLSEVEGIIYRAPDGTLVETKKRKAAKITEFPMPNWDFFDIQRYLQKSEKLAFGEKQQRISMPISTARGCAFRCTFCHFVFWDDPYRFRTPDSIMTEIKRNIDVYGANYINFWDDLSFASIPQTERMVDAILKSGLEFDWMGAIRTDLLGKKTIPYQKRLDLAKKMKDSGCKAVGFALESGNEDILKMMNKRVEPSYFSEQIEILRKVGITANTCCVFGYPIETKETIRETFEMCYKNKVYPSIGFLLPLPYTGMYTHALENGFITDEDKYLDTITERQDLILNMTKMSDEEITSEIKEGAARLNELLNLGLNSETFIKTGGYKKHTKKTAEDGVGKFDHKSKKLKRTANDVSLNYAQEVFVVDRGEEKKGA